MICPSCGWVNLPGNEECVNCHQDLTPLDRPTATNCVEQSLMEDPISVLHPKHPVTIRPTTQLQSALQAMLACDIGTLLVTDETGKLVGILSERDLLTKVAGLRADFGPLPVSDFMTAGPETIAHKDTLNFALQKMAAGGYRHLPVMAGDIPIGVISVRDMLRHIVKLCHS